MYEHAARPANTRFKNTVLRNLPSEAIARLKLRPVTFELGHEIEFPGQAIRNMYFVEEGVISMTVTFEDGSEVEVGMFGFESVIGISALMGTKKSLNRAYAQIPGNGYFCSFEDAAAEFRRHEEFEQLALRYVQTQLVQCMQSAACNAKHSVEQRLARWLLICGDRAHSKVLPLSQEYLAQMLGSTRSTVTLAMGLLKERGLIDYKRGAITITDWQALERRACSCFSVIKHHLDSYSEFDTGYVASGNLP